MTEATNDTARKHVDELIAGGKALYRVFELLDPLSAEDSATPRIRTAVVGIVDGLDALGESPADGVKAAAAALLEQDEHDKAAAFEGWQSVLDAARPYHRTIAVVCSDYPQWIAGLPSETLAPCLKTIGGLCTCYGNDACGLVDTLLRQIKPLAPARQAHHLDTMETYGGHLDTKPLKDLMVVLPLLYELADEEILNRFRETFPVDDLAEKRDAIKCMRATAALAETLSSEERALAVPLVMAAAARSHGSASQVAARLPLAEWTRTATDMPSGTLWMATAMAMERPSFASADAARNVATPSGTLWIAMASAVSMPTRASRADPAAGASGLPGPWRSSSANGTASCGLDGSGTRRSMSAETPMPPKKAPTATQPPSGSPSLPPRTSIASGRSSTSET